MIFTIWRVLTGAGIKETNTCKELAHLSAAQYKDPGQNICTSERSPVYT